MSKLIEFFTGNSWQRNLLLAGAAVVGGALLVSTSPDVPFRVDWTAFAAVVWVALRGGVAALVALLKKPPSA